MSVVIDARNPIELRKAGLRALSNALGYDGAQAFMNLSFGGSGDFTKEKYEHSEQSFEEVTTELLRLDAERK